jgi:uncharacterized membrane protein
VLASFITLSLGYSAVTLGNRSFWLDELYTYAASDPRTPFATLLQYRILPDVHPPLYYLTAHLWAMVFGPSEVGYRSLSLSFAILTVPASLSLGRALSGRWDDSITLAALIATSPAFLIYSQETRSYSMLLFASCTVYATTLWLIRSLKAGKPHHFLLSLQSASMLVAGLTHYFGYFITGLAALGTLTIAWRHRRRLLLIVAAYGQALFSRPGSPITPCISERLSRVVIFGSKAFLR